MNETTPPPVPAADAAEQPNLSSTISTVQIMYVLHGLAPFTFYTLAIVALIIGAVSRDPARGTWLDSHFSYLARTFWWGVLAGFIAWSVFWVLGLLTLGIGMLILWVLPVGVLVWYLYRVIVGWLALGDRKPV